MANKYLTLSLVFFLLLSLSIFYSSCEKQEDVIQKDSEQLMTDLRGKWSLVHVREISLVTPDGGFTWEIDTDDTITSSGELDIAVIDGRNYTGSFSIEIDTMNEMHAIYGNSYKNTVDERLYINTQDQSNIEAFLIFGEESSNNTFYLYERDQDSFLMWRSEINGSYTRQVEKHFYYVRVK
jgi:hypothetical protein